MNSELKIGVVGYSHERFDHDLARSYIREAYDLVLCASSYPEKVSVVSGLTKMGIPRLAYEEADRRDWRTVGIACNLARDPKKYELYPVDEMRFFGKKWGDESREFLKACDVLIRVGGGDQSLDEVARFKKQGGLLYEYDLPTPPC